MTKAEERQEADEIRSIFQEEYQLICHHGNANAGLDEISTAWRSHLKKHYAKDVLGVHVHHCNWPLSKRQRPKQHPLKGVRSLEDYYSDMLHVVERTTHLYHTLTWVNVKEGSRAGERVALAGLVVEGLDQMRQGAGVKAEGFDPHYCHFGAWVLRKAKGGRWKVQTIFSGFPVDTAGAKGGKSYRIKLQEDKPVAPSKKKLKYFRDMHQRLYKKGKKAEWQQAWEEAIPRGKEKCQFSDWSALKQSGGVHDLWDLLGWDVVISQRDA